MGEYTVSVELTDEAARNYQVNGFTATLTIQEAAQDVFYISGVPAMVYYGDEFTIQANGANGTVTWGVKEGDAEIDGNGHVKVTGTGSVTLTATSVKEGHTTVSSPSPLPPRSAYSPPPPWPPTRFTTAIRRST